MYRLVTVRPLQRLRSPYAFVLPSGLASLLLAWSGCQLPVDAGDHASVVRSADLSLVQALDGLVVQDGNEAAYRRADVSRELVYGRRASASDGAARGGACAEDPRVRLGLVSFESCVGAELFFREPFGGNGRTCGSCHPVANNFTLDAEYIATLPDEDALFVAEQEPALSELEHSRLLREYGLILENVDGLEDPTRKFVMRSVSHTFSLATSITPPPRIAPDVLASDGTSIPPVHRTGWSGDGAPGQGALRDFARGAVEQHATRSLERAAYVDFIPPTEGQLDALETFQLNIGRKNDIDTFAVQLRDAGAERGRQSILFGPARVCEDCHINAGANNINIATGAEQMVNSVFPAGTDLVRLPILDELGIPLDGGFGKQPVDRDGDGVFDSFGKGSFNSQPLIEAADTAPFFHANSASTLEEAIRFYMTDEFRNSSSGQLITQNGGGVIPFDLTDGDVADLGRFLRVINVAFNCQLALARLSAAFQISDAFGNRYISIQRGLLELAKLELNDALEVLGQVTDLNQDARDSLHAAERDLARAGKTLYRAERSRRIRAALIAVSEADEALGTGMEFQIGEGSLMF